MERKQFVQNLGAVALLASLGISLESCSDDESPSPNGQNSGSNSGANSGSSAISVDISSGVFAPLQNEDSWVLHPSQNILLVNVEGVISAFSSVCPHSACARDWEKSGENLRCTCHGSEFGFDGSLVKGPAGRGLTRLSVNTDGNTVTIQA